MEETKLESLFRQPLMLIEESKFAANEGDSYIQECQQLHSRLGNLSTHLREAVNMMRQGNPRFCESPTQCIVDETSRTLEKCCLLLRKCTRGGFLKRVLTITSAGEFKKANTSVDEAVANVKWLIESVRNEELDSVIGMPPITSVFPNRAVIWSLLSKLQGGTRELQEAAASHLAFMAGTSEQNRQFVIEEGGVPLLLKVLHDGTLEGKIMAATVLGNLASSKEWVRRMVEQGIVPACVHVLEKGEMPVQAKVAWALSEMVLRDSEIQIELGDANAVEHLTGLMFETTGNLSVAVSPKVVPLQAFADTSLRVKKGVTISDMPSSGAGKEKGLSMFEAKEGPSDDSELSLCASEIHNSGSVSRGDAGSKEIGSSSTRSTQSKEIGSSPRGTCGEEGYKFLEAKLDLKVQVTRALWLLAANNVKNSRRITETRAMLDFAKLMEMEQGTVQSNAINAVMELAAVAEGDKDFRKCAFKLTSSAAKAIVSQLHRLIVDESVDPALQMCCIKAVGSLAKIFSTKDEMMKALVPNLSISHTRHLGVIAATLYALLKFTDKDNFLCKEHSLAFLDVPGLPLLVQLVVLDDEEKIQAPAILLLSQLALHVGRVKSEAFKEAAALSILKYVAASAEKLEQSVRLPIKDCIFEAICHLEFGQAGGKHTMYSSHAQ